MSSLVCVVVGVGATGSLTFDEADIVEAIPEKLVEKIDEDFDPSRVVLYSAKHKGKELSTQQINELKRGTIPAAVKAIMVARNQLDPKASISSFMDGSDGLNWCQVDVLFGVPGDIKTLLRTEFAGQISCNNMRYYHSTDGSLLIVQYSCCLAFLAVLIYRVDFALRHVELAVRSWLCGVDAIVLGMYLYSRDENLIRGVAAALDPSSGKLSSVGIPGVVMWILVVLAYVLAAGRAHIEKKCDGQHVRLRYGTFSISSV